MRSSAVSEREDAPEKMERKGGDPIFISW